MMCTLQLKQTHHICMVLTRFLEDNNIICTTQSDFKYKPFFSEKKQQACNVNINLIKFDAAVAFMEQLQKLDGHCTSWPERAL